VVMRLRRFNVSYLPQCAVAFLPLEAEFKAQYFYLLLLVSSIVAACVCDTFFVVDVLLVVGAVLPPPPLWPGVLEGG